MRVLMFGWEFPPHISGGLGSACEGIVRALTQKGTDVIFVLPKLASDKGKTSNVSGLMMCSASGTRIGSSVRSVEQVCRTTKEYWKEHLRMEVVDSLLSAYATPEYYEKAYAEYLRQTAVEERRTTSSFPLQGEEVLQLHGGYGKDLMSEVYKYSLAGQAIARANDFDVIHAHDWMAYPAGILAKEATGKPLVCHLNGASRTLQHAAPTRIIRTIQIASAMNTIKERAGNKENTPAPARRARSPRPRGRGRRRRGHPTPSRAAAPRSRVPRCR